MRLCCHLLPLRALSIVQGSRPSSLRGTPDCRRASFYGTPGGRSAPFYAIPSVRKSPTSTPTHHHWSHWVYEIVFVFIFFIFFIFIIFVVLVLLCHCLQKQSIRVVLRPDSKACLQKEVNEK